MTSAVPAARLVHELRALGVRPGGVLMVHASLRRVGPVAGGAQGLLDALVLALGAEGTLLMVLSALEGEPFDSQTTPVDTADMGMLAEILRRDPRARVNDHPADRFGAIGPRAETLLEPSPLDDYHGPGSVLERLVEAGGQVLRLGANVDTVTLTHYAEYLAAVPDKRRVRRRYLRRVGGEVWIESLDDSEGIVEWARGDYFPRVLLDYLAAGHARRGPVGNTAAELLEAGHFVRFAAEWMERHLVTSERRDGAR